MGGKHGIVLPSLPTTNRPSNGSSRELSSAMGRIPAQVAVGNRLPVAPSPSHHFCTMGLLMGILTMGY
jgi:hypothetical protein